MRSSRNRGGRKDKEDKGVRAEEKTAVEEQDKRRRVDDI